MLFLVIKHPEHKNLIEHIRETISYRETNNKIATEQFYDITTHTIELLPWEVVNNQVRFRYNSASSNHYVDKGGTYYVYIPDNILQIYINSAYPSNDSLQFRNKSKNNSSMYGIERSSTDWDIGDTIEVYTWTTGDQGQPEPTEIVFNLVLTDDYSLGWVGAGLPPAAVYPENSIGINGFLGDVDRHEMRVYDDDDTTMTFFGSPNNPVLNRGSNYYLYIPSEINQIKMNYPYWVRNETKNSRWNSGVYNQTAGGINTRGSEWSIGDLIAVDNSSSHSNSVFLTITDVLP